MVSAALIPPAAAAAIADAVRQPYIRISEW
jgi:hypothetical protein